MNFDLFIRGARETVCSYVNAALPQLTDTLLGGPMMPEDVYPNQVASDRAHWSMLAETALPDGRTYHVEYNCQTGAWSLTAYRREAAKE